MVIYIFLGIVVHFTQETFDIKAWLKYQNSFKYLSLLTITTAALKKLLPLVSLTCIPIGIQISVRQGFKKRYSS